MSAVTIAEPKQCLLYKLQPKQKEFALLKKRYIAFGGARGGGKSFAVREKAKRMALNYNGIRMLLVRKRYVDLYENHIVPLRRDIGEHIAKFNSDRKAFEFFNGSVLVCKYFDSDNDALQFQGQEFDVIFLEEATQFGEVVFHTLKACLRGANKFPKRMYLTCNPGGVGHAWVKRLFIKKDYRRGENPDDYDFIQSLVTDNEVLMRQDPEYKENLESLPPALRKAWLEGSWELSEGAYFAEFSVDKHVIDIMPIDPTWRLYRVFDYGLDMLACLWVGVDSDRNCYVYRHLHESNLPISTAAKKILDMTSSEEKIYATLAPPDMWNRTPELGKDKASIFSENGLSLTKVSADREAGSLAVNELLKVDNTGYAKLKIYRHVKELIEYLPELQIDSKKPSDCLTEPHEITHICDALRYFAIYWTNPYYVSDKRVKYHPSVLEDWYNARSKEERALIEKECGGKPLL